MFVIPSRVPNYRYFLDRRSLNLRPLCIHWNRQPLQPLRRFDPVTIAPAAIIVLDAVIKNEHIGLLNKMKEAAPWDVTRLEYHAVHFMPVRWVA